jgi:hypothetical protein
MALRNPISQLCRTSPTSCLTRTTAICTQHAPLKQIFLEAPPRRSMATVVPPVTQDTTSSKGPTAMVFMNMGGPSTTDEVGTFLSRLFVGTLRPQYTGLYSLTNTDSSPPGRRRSHPPRPPPILPWAPNITTPHPQDPETIRRHWRWLPHPQMVRIPEYRDVQDPRSHFARDSAT